MMFLFCAAGGPNVDGTYNRDTMAAVIETPWQRGVETPIRGKFFSPVSHFLTGISFALEC